MSLEIITIKNNPVDSNCYLISDKEINNKCLIIDPGSKNTSSIEEKIESNGLTPDFILLTHEHFDHIWGCNKLAEKYNVIAYGSLTCMEYIKSKRLNCSRFYDDIGFEINIPTQPLETDETTMTWNGYEIAFHQTPGHSEASICFSIGSNLFTGDTLIYGLKTVTNILSGSKERLELSIKTLKTLQGKCYTVQPGHGVFFELDTYNLDKIHNK